MGKKISLDTVRGKLFQISKYIIVLSEFYKEGDYSRYFKCKCLIDGCEWSPTYGSLINHKSGCPQCNGNICSDRNRLSIVRPDLTIYFIDKTQPSNLASGSDIIVDLKCPDCGYPKSMSVYKLVNRGFSCSCCSDGVSAPEKFTASTLYQMNIDFKTRTSFDWSENKEYDFYIPSMNMIIETHGRQHYEKTNLGRGRGRTLKEEQTNDILKEKLAVENGIEHYIVIDCRNSESNWLKENCIKELNRYFDFCDIDWTTVYKNSTKNYVKVACDLFNTNVTVIEISKILNLNGNTIRVYLKTGKRLGWCVYDGKEEIIKYNNLKMKPVLQYDKSGLFLSEFKSITQASNITHIGISGISECCKGKHKYAGNFIWKYKKEDEYGRS